MDSLPDEPVKLFQRLTTRRDAYINLLRDVQKQAPSSLPSVGRALLEGLFEQSRGEGGTVANPKAALNAWNSVGDATKGILFSKDQIAGVDNFLRLADLEAKTPRAGIGAIQPSVLGKVLDPAAALTEAVLWGSGHLTMAKAGMAMHVISALGRGGSRAFSRLLWNPAFARVLSTPYQLPPAVAGATAALSGRGAEGYLQGGPVRDLERRALHRSAILRHLTQ
jgi:hypothetical protein